MTRPALVALTMGAVAAVTLPPVDPPRLVWNATASAPLGLWRAGPVRAPQVGDWVLARPRARDAGWLAARGYLPRGVLLLKLVSAAEGQVVCRRDDRVTVDGRLAARALAADHLGRPLPAWRGCVRLEGGEVMLLNTTADSLDGRYLGPTPHADIVARALPLWTSASW